ncbi:phenylalanine--tRNA ligase subunit beta [Metamycoplasma hominis]|uniref:phenylalanine--tRNA ligase subunit beta n=1 Tax=Metamycoplasma hominis TaxID=2098 RepID=UPI00093C308E|nr:phenylalanine--tRNA ligase subunit beta [Metamycoplasma hominis]OKL23884.1 phenylalanine--tRNA ligase subunit beta [Metamycoplasma hominis]
MLFSYKKIVKLANITDKSVEEVVGAINSIGFEVEEYHKFLDAEGMKFCHVLKAYKNPNSDRLTVCEVEFGNGNHSIIQTNATNMHEGDYVMAYVPGSRSGKNIFAAKELKGIISEGMFVSLNEIGIPEEFHPLDSYDGIFQVGKIDLNLDPVEYFDLDDYLIDVTILSNRADALCYLILAKEISAYFESYIEPLSKPKPTLESNIVVSKNLVATNCFSLVEATTKQPTISLQDEFLLWKHGIKTFRNAVDITNLVLLYAGVPCHVYNKNSLSSNEFSTSLSNETLNVLGNKQVTLNNNLVVKNGDQTVSIASVIGLENYEYRPDGGHCVFELASFSLKEVRKSIKTVKLETLASLRGSKEISSGQVVMAYEFLTKYLDQYSVQINAPKLRKTNILIDSHYITKYAGFNITKTKKYIQVLNQLTLLGFKIKEDLSSVIFPTYRYDLKNMQDFVEEVFRFYGYDNFLAKSPKITRLLIKENKEFKFIENFCAKGYFNVRTYTLINPERNIFNPFDFKTNFNAIAAKNYDHSQIRNSMISSLLEVLDTNIKQGLPDASYFEIAMINNKMNVLGIASLNKTIDDIKADICSITNEILEFKPSKLKIFNPNAAQEIYLNNELIGYVAKLDPHYCQYNAVFSEVFLDKMNSNVIKYKNYKHTPLKSRDVTISVLDKQSIEETIKKIQSIFGVYKISIKDVYNKDNGTKNITLEVILEDWATKKFDSIFNK